MKKHMGLMLFVSVMVLSVSSLAWADLVEIKGEGFLNGQIKGETKDSITFVDARGAKRVIARKDILYIEKDDKNLGKGIQKSFKQMGEKAAQVKKSLHEKVGGGSKKD